ncbi:MAG: adenosylcobinamide-GDP ribazoletransferase, partial [Oligoflexales bacterium]|nr:adenosylcobinamide-GDP ribazoletransferase [Oligoflexales bacterium]
LVQLGAWYQIFITPNLIHLVLVSFVVSRSLTGLAVVKLPLAKSSGIVFSFAEHAERRIVVPFLSICTAACLLLMIAMAPPAGFAVAVLLALLSLWFWHMSRDQFGGITGDLAGFYLVLCETSILVVLGIMGRVAG